MGTVTGIVTCPNHKNKTKKRIRGNRDTSRKAIDTDYRMLWTGQVFKCNKCEQTQRPDSTKRKTCTIKGRRGCGSIMVDMGVNYHCTNTGNGTSCPGKASSNDTYYMRRLLSDPDRVTE